ncbi:MAG: hypothetical protein M1546_09230 [Chloroflexi bacterium]|nr:hypothetical protein [Chloroflexota bacterium]
MFNIIDFLRRFRGASDDELEELDHALDEQIPKKTRTKLEREIERAYTLVSANHV